MKKKEKISKFLIFAGWLILLVGAQANPAFAQKPENNAPERPNPTGDGAVGALGSGLISLPPGHSVRAAAVNVGGKEFPLQLLFVPVTEQGKAGVPIRSNAALAPGDAAFDKFLHPGGVNRILLYVQIRVFENVKDFEDIAPSLEIYNEQTGATVQLLSGADFVSIRPIFIPPLAPENQSVN